MKLTEIKQPSDAKLFESLDRENDTGYSTEDLMEVVRTEQAGKWSEPMDAEDLINLMEARCNGKT